MGNVAQAARRRRVLQMEFAFVNDHPVKLIVKFPLYNSKRGSD